MTPTAAQLARECGATAGEYGATFTRIQLDRFHARAQAQALRNAYNHAECLSDLMDMADELESKA